MRRRDFIAGLGGTAFVSCVARAQQAGKVSRIGFFSPAVTGAMFAPLYRVFIGQLRELGFSERQNLAVIFGEVEDPRGLTIVGAELVQSRPDLIVVSGTEVMLQAVLAGNPNIPIVLIAINFDPIARGYIANLAQPGGNITGVTFLQIELAQKQVELLTQTFPGKTRLVAFYDAQTADQFSAAEASANMLHLQIQGLKLENPPYNFDAAFRSAVAAGAEMVLVQSSPLFIPHQAKIAELAKVHRLPTMFLFRPYVEAGGLMSYGVDFPLMYRRSADYVAKILKGAKPADLPVEQATKFDMIVNLKTAKAIGVELPTGILLRADEVIE